MAMASRALRRQALQSQRLVSFTPPGSEGAQRPSRCMGFATTSSTIKTSSIGTISQHSARWALTIAMSLQPGLMGRCGLQTAGKTTTVAGSIIRPFSTSQFLRREVKAQDKGTRAVLEEQGKPLAQQEPPQGPSHLDRHGFQKSEKAEKASQINLRAKLSKEGKGGGNTWKDVWRLIKIARPELKWFGLAIFLLITSSAVTMSIPKSVGKIIDQHSDPEGAVSLSVPLPKSLARTFGFTVDPKDESTFAMYNTSISRNQFLFGFGAILTLGAAANFGRIMTLRFIGERVVGRLRSRLYKRTYTQDAEFFDANRTGDLLSRLSTDTLIVGKSVTQNMSDGLRSAVTGGVALGCMAYTSLELTSILLWAFPPVVLSAFFYGRKMRNLSRLLQKNLGSMTKVAEERLGNVKTSQAFAGESQEIHRFNREVKTIAGIGLKEGFFSAVFFSTSGWMGNMTILALLGTGTKLVGSGALSVGDLTTFMLYTVFAGSSIFGISGFYSELMKGAGAASRLFELQDRDPLINTTAGKPVTSALGPITFENVNFAYPVRPEVTVFNGLDFTIPSGSNVCVVGPSGGGKSTVASLLLRFYDVTGGSVKINGTDVRSMNLKSLRRRIGLVGQEPVLFSGSIAENIAYGRPFASREDIIAAAQKANCQFISDFPDGLETKVGPRGAQLSGGQKQRVAIARALLKNPDILILDEATSALDAESETLVNSALNAVLKGHATTISIAHRLSTIKRSDSIIVLNNDGKVAEIGSFKTLSANKNSAFSQLMAFQTEVRSVSGPRRGEITEQEEIEAALESEETPVDEELEKERK